MIVPFTRLSGTVTRHGAVAAKKAFPKERDKPSVDARWVKKKGLESGFS